MESEYSRGEILSSFLGAAVPAAGVASWYYIEVRPMFRALPQEITVEQAAQFTALNSLMIFTAFTLYFAFKLMNVGSVIGRWIHWKFFQGGENDGE